MNGQTSLLDTTSRQKDPVRFTVSVERTVNLGNYESMRVGLAESFESNADQDQAYRSVLEKVQAWTSALKPETRQNGSETPRPAVSKLATLQEQLGQRLQDLELNDGLDSIIVKPRKYLGDSWKDINDVVRALGGHWICGQKPADGAWRIPKLA